MLLLQKIKRWDSFAEQYNTENQCGTCKLLQSNCGEHLNFTTKKTHNRHTVQPSVAILIPHFLQC